MRVALLVVACFGLALASDLSFYKFTKFVNEFGKDYHTKEEFDYRFNAFKDNLKKIDRLNALNIAAGGEAVFGINIFADMPAHEFAQRLMKNITLEPVAPFTSALPELTDIDWRNSGAVTAVKDQGQCGSCWAHSATEAVESYSFLLKEVTTLQTLSVQQTTACTYNYNGCNGGWPYDAYTNAVIKRNGEDSAADYPYNIAQAGNCKFGTGNADKPVANIKGYKNIARGQLADALASGPPSVCVAAEAWQTYTGGILKTCAGSVDHCVQAVGIGGSSSTEPYWIVRNSWGTSWGIKGYIYLDATVDSGDICHIQEYILWHQHLR
jgi:hypothetical protein